MHMIASAARCRWGSRVSTRAAFCLIVAALAAAGAGCRSPYAAEEVELVFPELEPPKPPASPPPVAEKPTPLPAPEPGAPPAAMEPALEQLPPSSSDADVPATGADPQSALVYIEAARKFRELGDNDNALASFRRGLRLAPDNVEAQYETAELLSQMDRRNDAVQQLRDILQRLHFREVDRRTGRIRRQAENLLGQLDEMGTALAESAGVLVHYGNAAEEGGRPENALTLYTRALDIWPACSEARERATSLCREKGWDFPATVEPEAATEAYIEIGELQPASIWVKNGEWLRNRTRWGLPIYNGGQTFDHGLWAPAPSKLMYALNAGYKQFTARILISAFKGEPHQTEMLEKELNRPGAGTVRFLVIGDGRTLFESGVVSYATGPQDIAVDVTGVQTLTLEVSDADGSDLLDFAVWADGRLFM